MELCCQRNIPLVFLQNTAPQSLAGLSLEERACVIKDQAKMMTAVACAQVCNKPIWRKIDTGEGPKNINTIDEA